MKKLITILTVLIVAIGVNAQTATFSTGSGTITEPASTYTLTNTTNSWFLIKGYTDWITTQDFQVKLDSLTGNHTNVAVALYGRKFGNDSWTQIGSTVNWKGTTVDTTITISNTSAARWREYKASFTGTGTGTSKIELIKFKLWYQ